jgi:uroporphyrin-III C-methyltransferase / precorrin-2 dehydrogenase / sirohydrochlorin ferrochelatase
MATISFGYASVARGYFRFAIGCCNLAVYPSKRCAMRYYPIGLDLKQQRVLLVGAGQVAARKFIRLHQTAALVHVVAPTASASFVGWQQSRMLVLSLRPFAPADLSDVVLVIAATSDRAVNRAVSNAARARGIPVNVVDDPELSTAILPAVVERGALQIAISTDGIAPAIASWLRNRLEAWLDPALGGLLALLHSARDRIRLAQPDPTQRRALYHQAAEGEVLQALIRADQPAAQRALDQLIHQATPRAGRVLLVGAGPGDPQLLTIAAQKALLDADVVFHDRLVSAGVLKMARADAELIDVGKRCGETSTAQAEIHRLLIAAARAGKQVVRLKGGDPLTFARGGEELLALKAAGVAFAVIPGVTAATACAAAAGIALTHRGIARSVRFVTAHSREGLTSFELLRRRPDETLAIYMGAQRASELQAQLLRAGVSSSTPLALIENGTLPSMRVLRGEVGTLARLATGLDPRAPTLLLVGEVCALTLQLAGREAA